MRKSPNHIKGTLLTYLSTASSDGQQAGVGQQQAETPSATPKSQTPGERIVALLRTIVGKDKVRHRSIQLQ